MAAYLVVEVNEISDEAAIGRYIEQVTPLVEGMGGRYLARGPLEVVEGESPLMMLVVVEFPSMDVLKRFMSSPEYAPLRSLRQGASKTTFLAVDGF